MKLRQKIVLFAVVPLLLVVCVIAFTVDRQAVLLGQKQREAVKPVYLATKDAELKSYVALAVRSIAHLYESGRTDDKAKEEAKAILAKLEYGDDGYFFLYDLDGKLLMHPRLMKRVHEKLLDLKDANGKLIIQDLIHRARTGGGFEDYAWPKPSKGNAVTPKRAYVIELPNWGWMLGTGVYLDDVDEALTRIDVQVSNNIFDTMLWIAIIALLSVTLVIFSGWMLNIRERHDATLGERMRIARELHDGICQRLAAVKLQIETSSLKLGGTDDQFALAQVALRSTATDVKDIVNEVRDISHGLYPKTLEHGLAPALRQCVSDFGGYSATPVEFTASGSVDGLPDDANLVLCRIAQEALRNVRHAGASRVSVQLEGDEHRVMLTVCDDGTGIDPKSAPGMGRRNIEERMKEIGGQLIITSSSNGTTVRAIVWR